MREFKGFGGRAGAIMLAVLGVALVAPQAAQAATWQVNTTADNAASGTECQGVAGDCSLRQAIDKAAGGDTIDIPAGTYTLGGQLTVGTSVTITGVGAGSVTITAAGLDRVMTVQTSTTVTMSGVTITGGVLDANGGGILNDGTLTLQDSVVSGNHAQAAGGGIYSDGALTISDSTVSGNMGDEGGGGIDNNGGVMTITGSAISGNTTSAGGGGGIFENGGSQDSIVNSTITGNASTAPSSGNQGGGIYYNSANPGLTGINDTIAGNSAIQGSNVFFNDLTNGGFQNTIVADPLGGGGNCATSGFMPASLGNNLEDDPIVQVAGSSPPKFTDSCGFGINSPTQDGIGQPDSSLNDITGQSPDLGALANNGGPTQTLALNAGSPAIGAAATVPGVTTDQRGGPRPQPPGGAPDIGAYEIGAVVDTSVSLGGSPNPVTVGQPLTYTLTATNNGPSADPAFVVQTVDSLPAGVTLQSVTPSQGSCMSTSTTVTCQLGTVPGGASATVTIKVIPQSIGTLTNSAQVASTATDPSPANNSDSVNTGVNNAPIVSTDLPSGVSQSGATLNGSVNPQNQSTTYFFEYGTSTSYGSQVPTMGVLVGSDATDHGVSQTLSGLEPNRTYHYRVVATNVTGTSFGGDRTFTTLTAKPIVVTNPGSGVSQAGATLNGSVNPQNQSTTYFFEYGTSTSYGSRVPTKGVLVGSDAIAHAVSRSLSGLEPNRTYHYRIVAMNGTGTSFGGDRTFTTLAAKPLVVTNPGSGVSQAGATLNGRVNPQNQSTTYFFQYGTSTSYGSRVPTTGVAVGSDAIAHAVSRSLSGLEPNRTYHYRIVAMNGTGTSFGGDRTFTTLAAKPLVVTDPGTGVSQTGATLKGRINPQNDVTKYYFQYGSTTTYGSRTQSSSLPSGLSTRPVSLDVSGLHPGTRYHYRLVAVNPAGMTVGSDHTFFTFFFPTLHVSPAEVRPGHPLKVYGNAGECPAGQTVTLLSPAFSFAHTYHGQGAIYTTVQFHGFFSTTTRIPSDRHRGTYPVSGLCGRFPAAGARDAAKARTARAARAGAHRQAVWSGRLALI